MTYPICKNDFNNLVLNESIDMARNSIFSLKQIKEFAGDVIFSRGYEYYENGLVEDFDYNPQNHTIHATINGNYGLYSIKAKVSNNNIQANCNCPFDGVPCKHIVAVLLFFMNNKDEYVKAFNQQKKTEISAKYKLRSLSKDELINLILSIMKKSPSFKRELYLKLSVDKETSLQQFFKEIDNAFRKFENNNASTYEISQQFEEIIKQAKSANDEIKIEILWRIADGVLHELNQYGMDDIPFEEIVFSTMDSIIQILNSNPKLEKHRQSIQAKLEKYRRMHNCGIVDYIGEAIYELSNFKS